MPSGGRIQCKRKRVFRYLIAEFDRIAHGGVAQRQRGQRGGGAVRLTADACQQFHAHARLRRRGQLSQLQRHGLQMLLRFLKPPGIRLLHGQPQPVGLGGFFGRTCQCDHQRQRQPAAKKKKDPFAHSASS